MIERIAAAAILALAASACAVAEPIPVRGETPGRTCSDSGLDRFVGREATAELGAQMLRASNAALLRWVPHGAVVTMEYRADRLTVHLQPDNRIERISCG